MNISGVGEMGVGETGVGETGQIIGETGVGEMGVGETGSLFSQIFIKKFSVLLFQAETEYFIFNGHDFQVPFFIHEKHTTLSSGGKQPFPCPE